MSTHYKPVLEVKVKNGSDMLCFQKVLTVRDGITSIEYDYRFINRDINTNKMKSQRGQAMIPDIKTAIILAEAMKKKEAGAGWSEEVSND